LSVEMGRKLSFLANLRGFRVFESVGLAADSIKRGRAGREQGQWASFGL